LLMLIFGPMPQREITVEIAVPRYMIGGYSISSTVVTTWIVMACLILIAMLLRIFVIPHMQQIPKGIQNVLEIMVDGVMTYSRGQVHNAGEGLVSYIFSVAALMIGCAFAEMFGVRAPTSDITMTFALAFVTFILINYYGIKQKGIRGRLKALAGAAPVALPFRMIGDLALPVSMACRLFGNMLGGMVVMDLLYNALGSGAVGIPSVIGLYFNIFHPIIQTFIFITLTLTFINEAVE